MTSPERLRRRQRIEGTALVILGVFTVLMSFYFRAEDARQRACLTDQFHQMSGALQQRSALVDRDSRTTTNVILGVARATTKEQVRKSLDRYIAQQATLQEARRRTPLPPFPEGACE